MSDSSKTYRMALSLALALMMLLPQGLSAASVTRADADSLQKRMQSSIQYIDSALFMRMCDTLYAYGEKLDNKYRCSSLSYRSYFFSGHDNIRSAEAEVRKLTEIAETADEKKIMFGAWMAIVTSAYRLGMPLVAMEENQKMQDYAVKHNDSFGLAQSYIASSTCFRYSWDLAIENMEKAMELLALDGDKDMMFQVDFQLCQYYAAVENWDKAIYHAEQVKEYKKGQSASNSDFANIILLTAYAAQDDMAESEKLFADLDAKYRKGKLGQLFYNHWGVAAITYLSKAGRLGSVPEYLQLISDRGEYYKYKSRHLRATGQYKAALDCADSTYKILQQSIAEYERAHVENANATLNFQGLEAEHQRVKLDYQRKVILAGIVFVLLLVLWIIYLQYTFRKLRKTQKELLKSNLEIKAQKEAIQAQEEKVRASEEMKSSFIETMSHEIRTPLNAIEGFSDVMSNEDLSFEDYKSCAEELKQSVRRLTRVTESIMEMSQLITATEKPEMETVHIGSMCKEIIQDYNRRGEKELAFTCDIDSEHVVCSNTAYLAKVIIQLMENAIKFTNHGQIMLTCRQDNASNELVIAVTDTGTGIPKDKQEWVFERFTKLDPFKPGLGIGLYLCRTIMSNLGGSIRIDPDYTQGCRVEVRLQA